MLGASIASMVTVPVEAKCRMYSTVPTAGSHYLRYRADKSRGVAANVSRRAVTALRKVMGLLHPAPPQSALVLESTTITVIVNRQLKVQNHANFFELSINGKLNKCGKYAMSPGI